VCVIYFIFISIYGNVQGYVTLSLVFLIYRHLLQCLSYQICNTLLNMYFPHLHTSVMGCRTRSSGNNCQSENMSGPFYVECLYERDFPNYCTSIISHLPTVTEKLNLCHSNTEVNAARRSIDRPDVFAIV